MEWYFQWSITIFYLEEFKPNNTFPSNVVDKNLRCPLLNFLNDATLIWVKVFQIELDHSIYHLNNHMMKKLLIPCLSSFILSLFYSATVLCNYHSAGIDLDAAFDVAYCQADEDGNVYHTVLINVYDPNQTAQGVSSVSACNGTVSNFSSAYKEDNPNTPGNESHFLQVSVDLYSLQNIDCLVINYLNNSVVPDKLEFQLPKCECALTITSTDYPASISDEFEVSIVFNYWGPIGSDWNAFLDPISLSEGFQIVGEPSLNGDLGSLLIGENVLVLTFGFDGTCEGDVLLQFDLIIDKVECKIWEMVHIPCDPIRCDIKIVEFEKLKCLNETNKLHVIIHNPYDHPIELTLDLLEGYDNMEVVLFDVITINGQPTNMLQPGNNEVAFVFEVLADCSEKIYSIDVVFEFTIDGQVCQLVKTIELDCCDKYCISATLEEITQHCKLNDGQYELQFSFDYTYPAFVDLEGIDYDFSTQADDFDFLLVPLDGGFKVFLTLFYDEMPTSFLVSGTITFNDPLLCPVQVFSRPFDCGCINSYLETIVPKCASDVFTVEYTFYNYSLFPDDAVAGFITNSGMTLLNFYNLEADNQQIVVPGHNHFVFELQLDEPCKPGSNVNPDIWLEAYDCVLIKSHPSIPCCPEECFEDYGLEYCLSKELVSQMSDEDLKLLEQYFANQKMDLNDYIKENCCPICEHGFGPVWLVDGDGNLVVGDENVEFRWTDGSTNVNPFIWSFNNLQVIVIKDQCARTIEGDPAICKEKNRSISVLGNPLRKPNVTDIETNFIVSDYMTVSVTDRFGNRIKVQLKRHSDYRFSLSHKTLPSGLYYIQMINNTTGQILNEPFVVIE